MNAAGIELRGLTKRFGDVVAVRNLDLDIPPGELVVLLGPSGCGKTTVLRMIAGLEEVSEGTVQLGDRVINEVEPADRDVAMVFQNYALYPHMSVRKNLEFGLRMRRTPPAEVARKVAWAASVLGLDGLLDRRPGQLSGGQRQRVALGRAMVRDPRVFLFDEPLSNLDARLRLETRAEIAELHQKLGVTMVFVTHDQVEAMTLGDRIAVMKDGVLQQYDRPLDVYRRPANLFVASFIGTPSINTVAGTMSPVKGETHFVGEAFALSVGYGDVNGAGVLGIRPEAISLVDPADPDATLSVLVSRVESLGNETLVHCVDSAGGSWIVRTDPEVSCRRDQSLGLRFDRTRVHLFSGPNMSRVAD